MNTRNRMALGFALWGGPVLFGIIRASVAANHRDRKPDQPTPTEEKAKAPERLENPGIENTFRVSPRLYSGDDPHGAEALPALKKLGIRTRISVDGATPTPY